MWIPQSADELEAAVESRNVSESETLDFKRELPASTKKNVDLACDVAAMSTDGGVIIYGVAEDEEGDPTGVAPFALSGVEERVQQIVDTGIAEPPAVRLTALPKGDGTGYLVVYVPQSPRAPHMVTIKGNNRFYGRSGKTNRLLTEADVARLYERRARWETDRGGLLAAIIDASPYYRHQLTGHVHAFCRPVVAEGGRFTKLRDELGNDDFKVGEWLSSSAGYPWQFRPTLLEAQLYRVGAQQWRLATRSPQDIASATAGHVGGDYANALARYAAVTFDTAGSADYFFGHAVITSRESMDKLSEPTWFFETGIAGGVSQFLAVMGAFYARVGYFGPVDLGVAVLGGASRPSRRLSRDADDSLGYLSDDERHTTRVGAADLLDTDAVAKALVGPMLQAATGLDTFDPWEHEHHR